LVPGFQCHSRDQGPCTQELLSGSTGWVFIEGEVPLAVSFDDARRRLARLALSGTLASASEDAYGQGVTELVRVGPRGAGPAMSKLVEVRFQNLLENDDHAGLAVRWEATGAGGSLFPALDGDITVVPADGQSAMLRLTGSYRPPLGALGTVLDKAILHRVATATIRAFLDLIAAAIDHPLGSAPATR
jgi:hypothetical protein